MKKFTFYVTQDNNGGPSFLQPWGPWGCLWRVLLFLISLAILVLLLSFFRSCSHPGGSTNPPRPVQIEPDSVIAIADSVPIPGADVPVPRRDIDDPGTNLPSPDDNVIQPIDDDEIVVDPRTGRQMINDRINVILNSDVEDETYRQWAAEFKQFYPGDGYMILFYDPLTKLLQVQVPASECDQIIHDLPLKITDISFMAFKDGMLGDLTTTPNDPAFRDRDASWYFEPIQAYEAWDITQGSENVIVAIVDSYFDLRHPDLYSSRIVEPFSVKKRSRDVSPDAGIPENNPIYYHGSCVASMALANINNGNGACGIAPNCKFMPVSMGAQFTTMTILYGILYSIYRGASVINVSAGMGLPDEVEELSIEDQVSIAREVFTDEAAVWDYVFSLAEERHVTIVWASGNQNILTSIDPSKRNANTIRVSAVDRRLRKASFSNFGVLPQYGEMCSTVSAPGVDILGAVPGNRYTLGPGTSYSAPIVTGAVALMKSLDPTLSTPEISRILQVTGKPISNCTTIGPLLQIKDALLFVKSGMAFADDVFSDHSKIIGKWQTTEMQRVYRVDTGDWTGEYDYVYFNFTSEYGGTVTYYIEGEEQPCNTASVTIDWGNNSFVVRHTQPAGAFIPATFTFTKGEDGVLEYVVSYAVQVSRPDLGTKRYIKPVVSMPCE